MKMKHTNQNEQAVYCKRFKQGHITMKNIAWLI